ncbi:predicted protein [Naegleria gruberi]|uniref:Predicted protein n=1 Tax=Naegleria gruberi TaxID=5762 RepID=D2VVW6_NAEGR|nr:uncharacterized protein NAEGRDRAFT_73165 [Naegleria gruberi]EFC38974.1 predicted protein [Naegleria gruberi]|eukprot:XP_002671718.1 predicted protein [Naegleria gruberi strain NEG-M]
MNSSTNLLRDISTHPSEITQQQEYNYHTSSNTIHSMNNHKHIHHDITPIDIPLDDLNINTTTISTTTSTSPNEIIDNNNNNNNITINTINHQQQKQQQATTTIIIHHHYHHYDKKQEQEPIKSNVTTYPPLYLTPTMVMDKMKMEGIRKSKLTFDQMIILSLFAGIFKGVGCTMSLLTAGNSELLEKQIPGLQKFFFGGMFLINLIIFNLI